MTTDLAFSQHPLPIIDRYFTSGENGNPSFAGNKEGGGGVIYGIQAVHGGPIKIGYCSARGKVTQRLKTLQTGHPYKLAVVALRDGSVTDERRFHEDLSAFRTYGEWFHPHKKVVAAIGGGLPSDEPSLEWVYDRGWFEGWQVGFDDAQRCEECGEKECGCDDGGRGARRDEWQAEVKAETLSGRFYAP